MVYSLHIGKGCLYYQPTNNLEAVVEQANRANNG
jgi:hypothetical protein